MSKVESSKIFQVNHPAVYHCAPIGYCLNCGKRLTLCGVPFSGEFQCKPCGAVNIYEDSQQPIRLKQVRSDAYVKS